MLFVDFFYKDMLLMVWLECWLPGVHYIIMINIVQFYTRCTYQEITWRYQLGLMQELALVSCRH